MSHTESKLRRRELLFGGAGLIASSTLLAANTQEFVIPANNGAGVRTFTLKQGQVAKVSATGSWLTHPHGAGGQCGPAGNGVTFNGSGPYPGAPEGCLVWEVVRKVGMVVNQPRGYFKKNDEILTLNFPGPYLWIANDNKYDDNKGQLTIHVTIT